MLTKEIVVGSIEILEDLQMQVREDTVVTEEGVELSRTYLRYTLAPGDDVSARPQLVQEVAAAIWPAAVQVPATPPATPRAQDPGRAVSRERGLR